MTKADFVSNTAKIAGVSVEVAKRMLDAIEDEVKALGKRGDSLTLPGFLSFKSSLQAGRDRRNPRTGEQFRSQDKQVIKIKAGKKLSDHVAGI